MGWWSYGWLYAMTDLPAWPGSGCDGKATVGAAHRLQGSGLSPSSSWMTPERLHDANRGKQARRGPELELMHGARTDGTRITVVLA